MHRILKSKISTTLINHQFVVSVMHVKWDASMTHSQKLQRTRQTGTNSGVQPTVVVKGDTLQNILDL
jgi:hypothetical protein